LDVQSIPGKRAAMITKIELSLELVGEVNTDFSKNKKHSLEGVP